MLAPKSIGNGNTVTKKDLVIVQPHLGELSLEIRTGTNRRIKNNAPECVLHLFSFQTKWKSSKCFTFKDRIPSLLHSDFGYEFKTKRSFKGRMCETFGISALSRKTVKGDDDSTIKEHLLFCNHSPGLEDLFSIHSHYQQQQLRNYLNRDSSHQ